MPTDEDILTLPAPWRRHLHPRRGGAPGPAYRPGGAGIAAIAERAAAGLAVLRADDAVIEAAHRHQEGTPDPVGAAVIAALATAIVPARELPAKVGPRFVDQWAAECGTVFAARALVERSRRRVDRPVGGGPWKTVGLIHERRDDDAGMDRDTSRRARALLAAAPDAEYAEAERALKGYRTTPALRWLVSYLIPTRRDWADECLAESDLDDGRRVLKLCTIGDAAPLADLRESLKEDTSREVLVTLADALGADLLPYLLHHLDGGARKLSAGERTAVCETIAILPSDAAFRALLDRADRDDAARQALGQAAERFPIRALRLLAAADTRPAAALLENHVRTHADAATAALPGLPGEARAAIEPLLAASAARVPEASPEELPAFLADLPWDRPVRPVVAGLEPPADRRVVWPDGAREEWTAEGEEDYPPPENPDWEERFRDYHDAPQNPQIQFLLYGPVDQARTLIPDRIGTDRTFGHPWLRGLVARHGYDAFPLVHWQATERNPKYDGGLLLPFLDADVAALMAGWFRNFPRGRDGWARKWLYWHGVSVVPFIAPAALGRAARPRRAAETVLRHMADRYGLDEVVAAFPRAADELRAVLTAHPARTGLSPRPKIGDLPNPAALPPVLLRGGERALPGAAVRTLVELLSLLVPYGLDEIREALDPGSLAEFGRALLDRWVEVGAPAKDGWVLTVLGRTGDDATARRLVPLLDDWPAKGGHAKAVRALEVLVEIRSDTALAILYGTAERSRFEGLREEARHRFDHAAAVRRLAPERLADRLVPDLGLDADASTTIDYGPRRFTVRFDEQLAPRVFDADGTPRKDIPKPAAKDDPAAYQAFVELKQDVRWVVSDRRRSLRAAMVAERPWTLREFRDHFVRHPIVGRIARRLVWLADEEAFRVAEDGTFADVRDDPFVPSEDARIRVAHPIRLGADLKAWAEVFADYELLQPFPQLERPIVVLTEDERGGVRLPRFDGLGLWREDVGRLTRWKGWEESRDEFRVTGVALPVADRRHLVADIEETPPHSRDVLRNFRLAATPDEDPPYWLPFDPPEGPPGTFGELDPVKVSEGLATLIIMAEKAGTP